MSPLDTIAGLGSIAFFAISAVGFVAYFTAAAIRERLTNGKTR